MVIFMKAVREEMGLSQVELASLLGVSPRTIQSCEQGWRSLGSAVEKSLLLLLMVYRQGDSLKQMACWEARGCSQEMRSKCLTYISGLGYLCWFLTGNQCACKFIHDWADKKNLCMGCPFFQRLFGEPQETA